MTVACRRLGPFVVRRRADRRLPASRPGGCRACPRPSRTSSRPEWSGRHLVRAEAGIRIKELNAWLDRHGPRALRTWAATTTRPSPASSPPRRTGRGSRSGRSTTSLRSLDVVVGDGRVQRIEPTDGPTDRAAYEAHHGDRRDAHPGRRASSTRSASGMGCMGVICTAHARGRAQVLPAGGARAAPVGEGPRRPRGRRRPARATSTTSSLFSPYERKHAYPCLVTTRNVTDSPAQQAAEQAQRNWLVELASLFPLTPHADQPGASTSSRASPPFLLENAMPGAVKDEYDEVSYKVLQHRRGERPARLLGRDRRPDGRPAHRGGRARSSRSRPSAGASATSTRARRSRCASSRRRPPTCR